MSLYFEVLDHEPHNEVDRMTEPLRIDIVSDVMCPWCVIAHGQLTEALEATGTEHEIHWHAFELNPDMVPEGEELGAHLQEKYGTTQEQSEQTRQRMAEVGAQVGVEFSFDEGMRMHNTFNTHQLLHWANEQGRKNDLKLALFTAHFKDVRNLSDSAVLADIAEEIGLDRDEALAVLEDQRFASEVRGEEKFWIEQGITGVPAVVFDRQHLVTGAQGVENYTSILDQLAQANA